MSKFAYWIAQETASEPKRGKPGTRHSVNHHPTAYLFGQSRLPFRQAHLGAEPPRLTNDSQIKPGASFFPNVFWLSPSRTDAVTRDRSVAVREKARGEKRARAIVNTKCVDFND
ncbi:hypothetical protein Enr13x_34370 [Stieleria neptunia]|uniref:Uncharacterized protein n=1 Tax=Stieleria neptunia TaxID=2527979 RepID=A0A518HRU8_9BACT|nr:hypothetical protein [Stieleria neptunia]QDV43580.1 hypothetical protein Enr13x_34370 [Stieleria neptunia]